MAEQGPLSNQKLGEKYLLGELLGQGGFGVVYKAEHILLHRPQAIKILLEQYLNSLKFRERFTREAQTLAALDHPNIVHVDDFGIEGSRAYLVMPYIGGGTLHGLLRARQGPLGLDEIGRYLEQICAALYYAHARNVAHLDLKPANLLIQEDGRLVLSDFGLAHLMGEGAIEGGASLQFGTPAYMAPEHLRGLRDRRSDVYSLGVILYQMLVGHAPFEGSTPAAIMIKQLTEPPPPLREARPDLPKPLEEVLAKALEKQPEERYQTPGELFLDFKAALGGRLPQPLAWQFVPPAAPRPSQPLPEPKRPFPIPIEPTPLTPAPVTPTTVTPAPAAPAGASYPPIEPPPPARAALPLAAATPPPRISQTIVEPTSPTRISQPPIPGATPPIPKVPDIGDDWALPTLPDPSPADLAAALLEQAAERSRLAGDAPDTGNLRGARSFTAPLLRITTGTNIWTKGFTSLFVVSAIIGGFGILGALIAFPHYFDSPATFAAYYADAGNAAPGVYVSLAVQALLAVACLIALVFTTSSLMEAGLLLQVGAVVSRVLQGVLFLSFQANLAHPPSDTLLHVFFYFGLFSSLLNVLSFICISYSMAGWRAAWDIGFGLPQLLLSVGIAVLVVTGKTSVPSAPDAALLTIAIACHLLAAFVVLGRPACWIRQPLITLCLVLGCLPLSLLSPSFLASEVFYDLFPVPFLFLIPGLLLLMRVQQLRKQALAKKALAAG
jgi:serine/threonine protein kinase